MAEIQILTKIPIKSTLKVIRVNPYWKRPWILRQYLHLMGKAPYQDMTKPYRERVIIVPVVRAIHTVKVLIQEIKELIHG